MHRRKTGTQCLPAEVIMASMGYSGYFSVLIQTHNYFVLYLYRMKLVSLSECIADTYPGYHYKTNTLSPVQKHQASLFKRRLLLHLVRASSTLTFPGAVRDFSKLLNLLSLMFKKYIFYIVSLMKSGQLCIFILYV